MSSASRRVIAVVLVVALASAVLVALLVPRDVLVTPAVTVEIVDKTGMPVTGIPVSRSSAHYSVERISTGEDLVTDVQGRVAFAPRRVRVARGVEWASALRKMARNADTGLGPRSWVIVALPGADRTGVSLFPDPGMGEFARWRCVIGEGCTVVK